MRISRFATLVLVAAAATPVLAGPLAPSKPSDIVTLVPDASAANGACGPTNQQQRVDAVINTADGSLSAFTIPDKEVLVLTGGTWEDLSAAANVNVFLELSLRRPPRATSSRRRRPSAATPRASRRAASPSSPAS